MAGEPGRAPPPGQATSPVHQGLRPGPTPFLGAALPLCREGRAPGRSWLGEAQAWEHIAQSPVAFTPSVSSLTRDCCVPLPCSLGPGHILREGAGCARCDHAAPATSGPPLTPRYKEMVRSVVTVHRSLRSCFVDEEGSCLFLLFSPVRCLSLVSLVPLTLRHRQVDLPRPSRPAASFCVSACAVAGGL